MPKHKAFRMHHATMGVYTSFDTLEDAVKSVAHPELIAPESYTIIHVENKRRVAVYNRKGDLLEKERYFHFPDLRVPKFNEITKKDLSNKPEQFDGFPNFVVMVEMPETDTREVRAVERDGMVWVARKQTLIADVSELEGDDRYVAPILEYMIGMLELTKKLQQNQTEH